MPFRLHDTLALATIVMGLSADGCAEHVATPSRVDAVTPAEVLAAPGSFLDADIRVRGQVYVVRNDNLGPADDRTGADPQSPSLQLLTVGERPSDTSAIDLYRTGKQGVPEPLGCRIIASNKLDCGVFTPGTVTVVTGRVIKRRVPAQQIVSPTGEIKVIRYREMYVLLIRPE